MNLTLKSLAHHRNGICGEPFYVVLFTQPDLEPECGCRNMVATVFHHSPGRCAVFDVDMLAAGNVTFGENSWRGDHYEDQMRAWIKEHNGEVS